MTREATDNALFVAAFMLVIGVPAFIAGAVMLWRRIAARWRGALVEAEVTRWETYRLPTAVKRAPNSGGPPARSTARPHFRYIDAAGVTREARLAEQLHRGEFQRWPIGARMPVRIDPARPDVAFAPVAGFMWVFPGLMLLAGTLASMIGLAALASAIVGASTG